MSDDALMEFLGWFTVFYIGLLVGILVGFGYGLNQGVKLYRDVQRACGLLVKPKL